MHAVSKVNVFHSVYPIVHTMYRKGLIWQVDTVVIRKKPGLLDRRHFRPTKFVSKCLYTYNLAYNNSGHGSECPDDQSTLWHYD